MTQNQNQLKVGDVVIYLARWGARPTTDNVGKVTKAGWVEINSKPGRKFHHDHHDTWYNTTRHMHDYIFPFSEEKLAYLNDVAERYDAAQAQRQEEQKQRQAERQAEREAQLATIKSACNNDLPVVNFLGCLDGSRIFTLAIPVHPEHAERKKGFEVVIVRLIDKEEVDWASEDCRKVKVVEVNITRANGRTSSFSSYSSFTAPNDTDGLWEAVCVCYHNY